MEELKVIVTENWPAIVSYALNIMAYFLFLVYRNCFSKTRDSMRVLFNDKVTQVNTIDKNMRADIEIEKATIQQKLTEAIEEYKKSKADYDACIAEISKMSRALAEIILEQEETTVGTDNK